MLRRPLCPPCEPLAFRRSVPKGEVVADYQQAVRGQTVVVEVVADSFSAEVHVGGRFEQHQDFVLELDLGGGSQAVGVEAHPVPPGKVVQDAESDVVSRMGVFGADVSQSGYQVFFHGACGLFFVRAKIRLSGGKTSRHLRGREPVRKVPDRPVVQAHGIGAPAGFTQGKLHREAENVPVVAESVVFAVFSAHVHLRG